MENFNQVIFGKKTFSDLLQDIYKTTKKTEDRIEELILALKPFINSPSEAIMIVPLIKEYLDVQVKNNDHLVRMASVIQRAMSNSAAVGSSELLISEEEKEQLLLEVRKMGEDTKQIENIDTSASKILENDN
jgi:hypothetical protein